MLARPAGLALVAVAGLEPTNSDQSHRTQIGCVYQFRHGGYSVLSPPPFLRATTGITVLVSQWASACWLFFLSPACSSDARSHGPISWTRDLPGEAAANNRSQRPWWAPWLGTNDNRPRHAEPVVWAETIHNVKALRARTYGACSYALAIKGGSSYSLALGPHRRCLGKRQTIAVHASRGVLSASAHFRFGPTDWGSAGNVPHMVPTGTRKPRLHHADRVSTSYPQ